MTDLDVVNRALLFINQEPISALDEASKPARVMSALLSPAKKVVLQAYCWSFASLRIAAEPAVKVPGYVFAYTVPGDALTVRSLSGRSGIVREWQICNDVIACDEPVERVTYTAHIEDLTAWSPLALDVLATRLAADAAVSLSGEPGYSQALYERYFAYMRLAQNQDAAGESVPLNYPDGYISCR